jgi:hypothetical protein
MTGARANVVIRGEVVVEALADRIETAEAVGIRDGRVVAVGADGDVRDAAEPGSRVVDARGHAIIPGLHDFHIHLVGLARTRDAVDLDGIASGEGIVERLTAAVHGTDAEAWITGRGWSNAAMDAAPPGGLGRAAGARRVLLASHDGHSAWASPAALALAGVDRSTADPAGGRIERDVDGHPTGVLRETALELVDALVPPVQGDRLRGPLDATLRELAAFGLTGATEAGDYTADGGIGADAAFGDSYSSLTDLADLLDGRLRMTLGIPADAIVAAAERGLRTGFPLEGRRTLRFGWAKEYADGALGSGTAALYEPRTCGDAHDAGILRVSPGSLDDLVRAARPAGIGLAIHAIGDRAADVVLDAVERAQARRDGTPNDRMEHAQLLRTAALPRFAPLGVTASIQPIHAAADRDLVEACWDGRQDDAYAWRGLVDAGAHLAAGSDAPVEAANPWLGMFAALHRRMPGDPRDDWRPAQRLSLTEALRAYTRGPAIAIGAGDEGHLRPGARADLAILSEGLEAVLAGDERLADIRSLSTLVDGEEVPTD